MANNSGSHLSHYSEIDHSSEAYLGNQDSLMAARLSTREETSLGARVLNRLLDLNLSFASSMSDYQRVPLRREVPTGGFALEYREMLTGNFPAITGVDPVVPNSLWGMVTRYKNEIHHFILDPTLGIAVPVNCAPFVFARDPNGNPTTVTDPFTPPILAGYNTAARLIKYHAGTLHKEKVQKIAMALQAGLFEPEQAKVELFLQETTPFVRDTTEHTQVNVYAEEFRIPQNFESLAADIPD